MKKRKVGRPPNHPKVRNVETGMVHDTYESAAKEINGYRGQVYLVANGVQRHHHGYHFEFVED